MNMAEPPVRDEIKKYVAECVQFALGTTLPANTDYRVAIEHFASRVKVSFHLWLLGREVHSETKTEQIPLTWWDHAKLELSLLKRLRRWPGFRSIIGPPRFRVITITQTHWHMCPHLAVPGTGPHYFYLIDDGERQKRIGSAR